MKRLAVVATLLPVALALGFVWWAESAVEVVLCAVVLLQPLAVAALPAERRRAIAFVQTPAILLGAFGMAAFVAANMASMLGGAIPWGQVVRYAAFVALWILALRLAYQALGALVARALRREAAAKLVTAVLVVVLGMPQLFVALQTHRFAIGQQPRLDRALAELQHVTFESHDGTPLRGTLVRQPEWSNPRPVVVVCHGVAANRANVFAYAELAWDLGCHAFAFDFRAHGDSGGATTTLGAREPEDVVAACRYLRENGFAQHPIVLVGVSMGGASALRAAADAGAAAVFAESAYADLGAMVEAQVAALGPLRTPAAWAVAVAAWLQLGISLDEVSPRRSLAALPGDVPVALVHAGEDGVIPLAEGRRLAAARPGLELQVVAGAGHGGCLYVDRARIERLLRGLVDAVR